MKKSIWIVNFHTAPPKYALNQRYAKIVPYLQKQGYEVTVISTAFLRRHQLDLSDGKAYIAETHEGIPFVHIKSNRYKGNGIGRMLSLFIFSLKLLFISKKFGKPDIIYHNLHVPFDLPVYFAAKRFRASYIAEVWDLWPEFFYRMGLIRKKNMLMTVAYRLEKWIYTKAERIVFTLEGGVDYIVEKGWDMSNGGPVDITKCHYINNGIDLKQFESDKKQHAVEDQDLDDDAFRVMYIGSMQKANNVEQIIKAADLLRNQTDIKFLLYGDGADRGRLLELIEEKGLDNVLIKETYLPFEKLPHVLSRSSLNIMNYQEKFGEYGISAGKFFLYLAAGKPIVSNIRPKHCEITKNNLGIAKNFETPNEYADAILKIKHLSEDDYNDMCKRVRKTADQYDYIKLSEKLIQTINNINV